MSPYVQQREATLAPGLQALRQKKYDVALQEFRTALKDYPSDTRVLMLAGNAARLTKNFAEAINDYQQALQNLGPKSQPWSIRFSLIETYAALGRWDDFDAERQRVRAAQQNGDEYLAKVTGYVIDEFEVTDRQVKAMEFPSLAGRFHTRYRFFISPLADADDRPAAAWTPFIDCESDDIDQMSFREKYPEKAAAGERRFSLDSYPQPRSHGTIKFYPDGEPSYRKVREDVITTLSHNVKPMTSTNPPPKSDGQRVLPGVGEPPRRPEQ